MDKTSPYEGGIDAILERYEARRDGFIHAPGEGLPPLECDLAKLAVLKVADPEGDPRYARPFRSSFQRKCHALRSELTGYSELAFLHALLVSHLRKRTFPAHAPALFLRLWAEQGAHLLQELDPRWLVSAITTFGDHGHNTVQKSLGLALTTFFGMMKLYESERLYSGLRPETAFGLDKVKSPLPMAMDSYALVNGGLDVNMIARLWSEAQNDQVIGPLVRHLLELLIGQEAGLFHRLSEMRADKLEHIAAKQARKLPAQARWGLVTTTRAPLATIARWAAHHIELGAQMLYIHLENPDLASVATLSRHPQIHVIQCDDAYWRSHKKQPMNDPTLRAAFNATHILHGEGKRLDWLGHLAPDEYLFGKDPGMALADLAADVAMAHLACAEALIPPIGTARYFKLTPHQAGKPGSVLEEIYPTFGMHLAGGFVGHRAGRPFARTGMEGTRLGVHALKAHGAPVENRAPLKGVSLAHFHCTGREGFINGLPDQAGGVLGLIQQEGMAALEAFYDEVVADTPGLRSRLDRHEMLLEHAFDFEGALLRVFGTVP